MNVFISAASGAVDTKPADDPPAEDGFPQLDRGGRLGLFHGQALADQPVDGAAVPLEEHVDHSRHQRQVGRSHQRPVLEQRRKVGLGDEIACAA